MVIMKKILPTVLLPLFLSIFLSLIIFNLVFINTNLNSLNNNAKIQYTSKPQIVQNDQTNKKSNKTDIILVNKTNTVTKNYRPENLTIPNVKFIYYADPKVKQMESKAAEALESLFQAASKDNITLLAVSGYRPYEYQRGLYNNDKQSSNNTDKYLAKPGTSEHQTGLAMDVLSDEYSSLDEGFVNTKAYEWLKENCYKYGFIIRYPKEKEDITKYNFEPWHIRYVGITHSKEITNKNLTLEEYLGNTD